MMPSFGLFLNAGVWPGLTHDAIFDALNAEARLADRLGYHDLWVTEHHFIPYGIIPNALTLAGYLLGCTGMRVGTATTLTPVVHPILVAEQVALLSQLSGGRLDLGIGRGGYLRDYEVFGVDPARWNDEVEASLDVLQQAWCQPAVASESPHFPFGPVEVLPKPRTTPPVFLATASQPGIDRAARDSLPLLLYWGSDRAGRTALRERYRAAGGRDVEHVDTILCVVGDDPNLRETVRERLIASYYAGDYPAVPGYKVSVDKVGAASRVAAHSPIGTPDVVADALAALVRETGATRIVCYMEPIVERGRVEESVERLWTEVRPKLADRLAD